MSKKNRRKAPDLATLRKLIRQKQQEESQQLSSRLTSLHDDVSRSIHPAHPQPKLLGRQKLSTNWIIPRSSWVEVSRSIADLFPTGLRSIRVEGCTIDEVYAEGVVAGTLNDTDGKTFQVFIRLPKQAADIPAGCSCAMSNGERPCPHALFFAKYVAEQIKDVHSDISKKIERRELLPGEPETTRFSNEWENFQYALKSLKGPLHHVIDPAVIREVTQTVPARICWQFLESDRRLHVRIQKQSRSKRGDKWNRPVSIRIADLTSLEVEKTPEDLRIIEDYFELGITSQNHLNACQIASLLIGKDNVFFADSLVEVCPYSPMLTTYNEPDEGRCGFMMVAPPDTKIYHSTGGMVCRPIGQDRLEASVCSSEDLLRLSKTLRECSVPSKFYPSFMEKARELQVHVSILLPEEVAGTINPLSVKPVLILRLQKDGRLDYAIRVRDELGVLRYPSAGPMVVPGTENGRAIQWKRDGVAEYHLVKSTCQALEIPISTEDGMIEDFEQAVDMLHRAESSAVPMEILWDKDSTDAIKLIGSVQAQNVRVKIEQKRDWFSLEGTCQVGSTTLEISQMLRTLRAVSANDIRGNFVRLGEHGWAKISKEMRRNLQELDDSLNWERKQMRIDTSSAIGIRQLQSKFSIESSKGWKECVEKLESAERLDPKLPQGVQAELREYQLDGFRWLRRLAEWGVGGILADDMGLGKTLQTLCVLLDRGEKGPSLVIAPTSVGTNWQREANKFAPALRTHLYRESDRSTFLESLGPMDLVICSYGLALRDVEQIAKVHWSHLILDEAQAIKNGRTKTSQAIEQIPSDWTLALTGTPVENHLGELWSIFKIVAPGVFGSWDQFRDRFASPIERFHDPERMEALRAKLSPFVLRRTKGEVLTDLPPRTETNLYVELSEPERQLYESVRQSAIGEIDALAKLPDIADQRFKLLALLTRLRQVACHPKMIHPNWEAGSAKLDQLMEKLRELKDEGHRTLIFSQFVQHLSLIRERLEQEKIEYMYLDGSTTPNKRQEAVDRFQNGEATAFLISLKAGGTGLNLTAADYVIHMDPWWNPAVEDQATDRAHRMGQTKPVFVYRIIAQGTIEEEILKLHESKRDLVAGILEGSHTAATVSTEDLIAMIRG